ncbi:MAG: hypothetical protein WDA60_19285 [Acidimicrobiia bacterium]|jgi:hypothetical protein
MPVAHIYEPDSGRFADADFHFLLEPNQRLPRARPGSLADAYWPVDVDHRTPLYAGEVEIRPGGRLHRGGQMFMERGNVVAHPAIVGAHPGWRYVESHSFDGVEAWSAFLASNLRRRWIALVTLISLTLVLLAVILWLIISGRSGSGGGGGGGAGAGGFGALGLIGALLLARRSQRALRSAQLLRDAPGEPMWMELWWSAGHGHGPVAIASLSGGPDQEVEMEVPVIGVPEEFLDRTERFEVLVHGRSTGTPLVEADGALLWPAERSVYRSPVGWQVSFRRHPIRVESS